VAETAKQAKRQRQREARQRRATEKRAIARGDRLDESPAGRLFKESRENLEALEAEGISTELAVGENARARIEARVIALNSSAKARRAARFFHGGPPGLSEGTELLPANTTGVRPRRSPVNNHEGVYVSEFFLVAALYALKGSWALGDGARMGSIYEVVPDGDLLADFEHLLLPAGTAHIAPRARILRRFDFSRDELKALIPISVVMTEELQKDSPSLDRIATCPRPDGIRRILFDGVVQWCLGASSWSLLGPQQRAGFGESFVVRAGQLAYPDDPLAVASVLFDGREENGA
jgi:hypothetical protein